MPSLSNGMTHRSNNNRFQETAMTLKGKTLFITGASRGIGLAIRQLLHRR
jgi:NADPH:quinone reductase-like Zn-dependent oxidoreductase